MNQSHAYCGKETIQHVTNAKSSSDALLVPVICSVKPEKTIKSMALAQISVPDYPWLSPEAALHMES